MVGYQEAGISPSKIRAYARLYRASPAPIPSVRCLLSQGPIVDGPGAAAAIATKLEKLRELGTEAGGGGGKLRVDGLKVYLDGVVEERTAALLQPYLSAAAAASGGAAGDGDGGSGCGDGGDGGGTSGAAGRLLWSDGALQAVFTAARASPAVATLHMHAIGDAAVHQAVRVAAAGALMAAETGGGPRADGEPELDVQVLPPTHVAPTLLSPRPHSLCFRARLPSTPPCAARRHQAPAGLPAPGLAHTDI